LLLRCAILQRWAAFSNRYLFTWHSFCKHQVLLLIFNYMRIKFLIIPTAFIFQFAVAQNGSASLAPSPGNGTASVAAPVSTGPSTVTPASASTVAATPESTPAPDSPISTQKAIMDYKSVYEAATVEEEVKMATERFGLTPAQQDMWLTAATERRETEKPARAKLESKDEAYLKEPVYRGLKEAQNRFNETIIGYLTPAQKNSVETDRLILQEKQRRIAKLPPPPPPAPTVTVAPVDSAAIKDAQKGKKSGKKSRKKTKQPVNQ
jgi:hypothetical protein